MAGFHSYIPIVYHGTTNPKFSGPELSHFKKQAMFGGALLVDPGLLMS